MSYWDTSALGKLYLPEPDSADFAQKAALDPAIATTRLALYEMRRVAFRKESEGFIAGWHSRKRPGPGEPGHRRRPTSASSNWTLG